MIPKEASMSERSHAVAKPFTDIVKAIGEEPIFKAGERVRISVRYPVGHIASRVISAANAAQSRRLSSQWLLTTSQKGSVEMLVRKAIITASQFRSPNCGRVMRDHRVTGSALRSSRPG